MGRKKYSLREVKHARTKFALMNAFMEELKGSSFDKVSVKDVCRRTELSEGTFFNYFPDKISVIKHYLLVLNLKFVWGAQKEWSSDKYLDLIDSFFKQTAKELDNSDVIYKVISILLGQSQMPNKGSLSALEKKAVFPHEEGIEDFQMVHHEDFIMECLKNAVKNGELPPKTNVDDVWVSLMSIMRGTLLTVKFRKEKRLEYHQTRQLLVLWSGLGLGKGAK